MNADPKRKSHQGEHDRSKRAYRHQEEALDDAIENTFPASESQYQIEQPAPLRRRQAKDSEGGVFQFPACPSDVACSAHKIEVPAMLAAPWPDRSKVVERIVMGIMRTGSF